MHQFAGVAASVPPFAAMNLEISEFLGSSSWEFIDVVWLARSVCELPSGLKFRRIVITMNIMQSVEITKIWDELVWFLRRR